MAHSQLFAFTASCLVYFFIETSLSSAAIAETTDIIPLPSPASRTQYCEYYNSSSCSNNSTSCYDREECEIVETEKRNHCFVLWTKNKTTGDTVISLKGCFLDNKECYDKPECVEEFTRPKDMLFCCCDGNMCNQNFTFSPLPTEATITKIGTKPVEDVGLFLSLIIVIVVIVVLMSAIGLYFYFRHKKMNLFNELPTAEPSCPPSPEGMEDGRHLPIVLREVRARGRFGAVWRAHLNQEEVAVKIFPVQDKQSWLSEQEIFKLPRMVHTDVLRFIGVEKRGDNLQAEYWLITAYHEKGSLCDYLKANTVTWAEAFRISHTMARGLTHLHDEVAGTAQVGGGRPVRRERKPAIAHRDFKSKNVLLKSDMSACIADFGLALVFQPGKPCGDTHGQLILHTVPGGMKVYRYAKMIRFGYLVQTTNTVSWNCIDSLFQVGTRRYMAPEVLEGAINFTRDAFLRIDMYACGLVLWEIASRCTAWGNVGEYMLPLEEEVGAHPSLEEMQDAVVQKKLRPNIPESWKEHNALSVLCDTMEECWDHDAEARLSASCVMERIRSLGQMGRRAPHHQPLLIENARPLRDD